MADQNDVDLDSIIDRLLEVRGSRPGKQVQLLETEIRYLCTKAREIFISQPILLELEAPIKANIFLPQFSPTHFTALKRQEADIEMALRFVVTYMANTTIFSASLSTEDFPQKLIIFS